MQGWVLLSTYDDTCILSVDCFAVAVGIRRDSLGGGKHNLLGRALLNVRLHSGQGISHARLEFMGLLLIVLLFEV